MPFKLGHFSSGTSDTEMEHSYPPVYRQEEMRSGKVRLVVGVPGSDSVVFSRLAMLLTPPYYLLYLLHTPRGEGSEGRYQSPEVGVDDLRNFLDRFSDFLSSDARFDFWVHSPEDDATVVWDRHNLIYCYGPTDSFIEVLNGLGFGAGSVEIPDPHTHNYNSQFDQQAAAVLSAFDWMQTPLRPGDEQ